jgi:hypothetical protein
MILYGIVLNVCFAPNWQFEHSTGAVRFNQLYIYMEIWCRICPIYTIFDIFIFFSPRFYKFFNIQKKIYIIFLNQFCNSWF